jgi:hypothetical protein
VMMQPALHTAYSGSKNTLHWEPLHCLDPKSHIVSHYTALYS